MVNKWCAFFFFQDATGAEHPAEFDDSSPTDASFVSQHALRQAELGRQLQELTKALALKEELANKMVVNDTRLTSMRKQYEVGETVRAEISCFNDYGQELVLRLLDYFEIGRNHRQM